MHDDVMLARAGALLAARPAATMDDLATAIGVSRATLFRSFGSREKLVHELCIRAVDAYAAAVDRADPENGDAQEALRRVALELAALAAEHGLLALQPLPDDLEVELSDAVRAADERIERLVARGQEDGVFRTDVPAAWVLLSTTWLVVAAADGLRRGSVAPRTIGQLVTESVVAITRRARDGR